MFFSAKGFWKPGLIHLFDTNFVLPHVISLLTWASNCMGGAQAEQWDSGLLHFKFCVLIFFDSFVCAKILEIEINCGPFDQRCHVSRRSFCAFYPLKRVNFAQGGGKVPVLSHDILCMLSDTSRFLFSIDRNSKTVIFFGRFNQNFNFIGRFFPHSWPETA